MSSTQQPEALRLAHTLSGGKLIDDSTEWADTLHAAAAELRHQHARIEELEAQLAATQSAAQGWKPVPVGWQFYEDGKWWNGDDRNKDHRKNTEEARYPIRDVYAVEQQSAQPDAAQPNSLESGRIKTEAAPVHPVEGVPAQAAQPSDALIEAVDAWFAANTGLGGCSDKDVSELAEIFATHPTQPAAAPAQKGWCDGCSPDNCCGCGPAAPAK